MKVLYYIHSLVIGGAETIVTEYLIALKEKGVEIVLVVNQTVGSFLEKRLDDEGIKIYALDKAAPKGKIGKFAVRVINKLKNHRKILNDIIAREKPDITHIHTDPKRFYGVDFPINKIVFSFHANVERALKMMTKKSGGILRDMANNGLIFLALTEQMEKDIRLHFKTDNIYRLPNAVNLSKIRREAYRRDEFLPTIGVPEDAFVLGHVGRFNPVKNHEKVFSVFNALHKEKENSYLILVGGGDEKRTEELKNLAEIYGLNDYVKFMGIRDDSARITACFDALVFPSFNESFSLVLVEAQTLGVRCVASLGVPRDVIKNDNCFSLPLEASDEEWAKLLLGKSVAKNGGDLSEFDLSVVTDKLIEIYKKVSDEKDPGADGCF